jgi:hypothetical protein
LECVTSAKQLRFYSGASSKLFPIDDGVWSSAKTIVLHLAGITSHLAAVVYYRGRHLRVSVTLSMWNTRTMRVCSANGRLARGFNVHALNTKIALTDRLTGALPIIRTHYLNLGARSTVHVAACVCVNK